MNRIDNQALDTLFRAARTYSAFLDKPVSDETLHEVYELMKWGPTSANLLPARIEFLRSREAKERLRPALAPGNLDKTMAAPVTAIVAYDLRFYAHAARLFPHFPTIGDAFADSAEMAQIAAMRNGSLQGGYFILAARAVGLDCGPMSGFDNDKVDAEFFPGTSIRSNFLCNLGYGDASKLYPRLPRLEFSEVCHIL